MAEVLTEHQRRNASSCLCGWAKLGHSHPEHQAAALTAAGFGLVADADAKVQEMAKRLLNEDIVDSVEILDRLASGDLKLMWGEG